MGAQSFRANRWHGRAHAEASRFIGSSTDDRTIGPPSDYYRLAAQLRVIPLFDGSIESVHIDMDDFADGHLATILFLVSTSPRRAGQRKSQTISVMSFGSSARRLTTGTRVLH